MDTNARNTYESADNETPKKSPRIPKKSVSFSSLNEQPKEFSPPPPKSIKNQEPLVDGKTKMEKVNAFLQDNLSSILNFRFLNLLILAFSFFIVFCGYNTAQNFMTSIHDDVGSISLGILYFVFAFSNFIAPTVIQILGIKWSIVLSFAPYCFYVLTAAIPTPKNQQTQQQGFFVGLFATILSLYKECTSTELEDAQQRMECVLNAGKTLFISYFGALMISLSSALQGFAAAVLWTSQGAYLARISIDPKTKKLTMGFFTGVFMTIYQSNLICGNLIVFVLLYFKINIYVIFVCLFFVAMAGGLLSLFLYPFKDPEVIEENKEEIEEENKELEENIESIEKNKGISSKELEKNEKSAKRDEDYETFGDLNPFAVKSAQITQQKPTKKPKKKSSIKSPKIYAEFKISSIPFRIWRKIKEMIGDTAGSLLETFRFLLSKKMLLFAPTMLYTGFANTFYCGTLPQMTKYEQWISLSYILFGLFACFSSMIIGKGNDLFGRRIMIYISFGLHALAIISSLDPIFFFTGRSRTIYDPKTGAEIVLVEGQPFSIVCSFILWGIADAALYTTIYAIIPQPTMFATQTTSAFASFNLYFAIATATMFIISIFLKDFTIYFQMWLIFMLFVSVLGIITLECCVAKFDENRKQRIAEKIDKMQKNTKIQKIEEDHY